ncbi:ribosome-associated translation inhibitor RaiA [Clostridium perfringens]|nr:ribosome-associated translation inhibitor RaiA [Clostridium perfringens]
MKVTVHAKNIELTNALKDSVEKKISKLSKYFEPGVEAKATLSVEKNKQIIEVMIPFNGILLRGEESTDDMYKSIDLVEEKIERQIRKQKTRLSKKNRYDSLRFAHIDPIEELKEEKESTIVKTKRFDVKPMGAEEAVLQMELIGHDFFVFQDADSNQLNVVYRRKDGNYGLIEPGLGED